MSSLNSSEQWRGLVRDLTHWGHCEQTRRSLKRKRRFSRWHYIYIDHEIKWACPEWPATFMQISGEEYVIVPGGE